MGSVIDGEDVVQDTFARAFVALDELEEDAPLRPWLFRIAHNARLTLLRSRAVRAARTYRGGARGCRSGNPRSCGGC